MKLRIEQSHRVISVIKEKSGFRLAHLTLNQSEISLELLTFEDDLPLLSPMREEGAIVVTGVEGRDLLIRHLQSPLKTKKALKKTLPFQLEALIPYSLDEVIVKPIYTKGEEGTEVTCFIAAKSYLESHLKEYGNVEPEWVSCAAMALYRFSQYMCPSTSSYLIIHIGSDEIHLVTVLKKKIDKSLTLSIGRDTFLHAYRKDHGLNIEGELDVSEVDQKEYPTLGALLDQMSREIARAFSFLSQKGKEEVLREILITGEEGKPFKFEKWLLSLKSSSSSLLKVNGEGVYSSNTLKSYAISIGLSLDALKSDSMSVQYREGDYASPHLVQRAKRGTLQGALRSFGLVMLIWGAAHFFLNGKEKALHRTLDHSIEHYQEYFPFTHKERKGNLTDRVRHMHTLLKRSQKSKTLFVDPPRVTDKLMYLSAHPLFNREESSGKIKFYSIDYQLKSFPSLEHPIEEYIIEVYLTVSSPKKEWIEELCEAFIEDDILVNSEHEISWKEVGGLYEIRCTLKS